MKSSKIIKSAVAASLVLVTVGTSSAFAKSTTPTENYVSVFISPETPVVADRLGIEIYQDYTLTFTTSVFDNYDLTELSTDASNTMDSTQVDSSVNSADNSSN